jgi:hypothetical protein
MRLRILAAVGLVLVAVAACSSGDHLGSLSQASFASRAQGGDPV